LYLFFLAGLLNLLHFEKMILSRIGNKQQMASDLIKHFPEHRNYVEMFFGAGGMFFNKPTALHNVCNDLDDDVYNLFCIVRSRKDELIDALVGTPIHQTLFKEWYKKQETDELWKAVRFLVLSNFSLLGKSDMLSFSQSHTKKVLLQKIDETFIAIQNVRFMNCDFRKVIPQLAFRSNRPNQKLFTFIYADPPYLGTTSNYNLPKWTKDDASDLINICKSSELNMAISEFDNPEILEMATGLNVIHIGERKNLKNRRSEILITNYEMKTETNSLF
jgi:DNA adenine methylase